MDKFKAKHYVAKFWPVVALFIVNAILFAANYKPGTYLIGWDNLMPELSIGTNIQRSIFAVWQEYQSLGLLGGMGHASDLIRQLYVLLLTFVLPQSSVRYFATFTMLFLGGLGAYFLTKHLIEQQKNNQILAFSAALFYTLNISTIQTFYAPFEAFISHFAALPWVLLASIVFIKKANFKNFIFLFFILLLSTPAAYIPTLFVVEMIAIGLYILTILILGPNRKSIFINGLKLLATIIAVNAFWLFPFIYFTLTSSSVTLLAKQNQMATQTIFLQNKEFGTLNDTALLKGFWFNNVDPNLNGDFAFMMAPWRAHFSNPLIIIAGFILFTIVVLGTFYSIHKKHKAGIAATVLFLFAFTMLATSALPFSLFDTIFRKIPLFTEAFRFPFTKFSILAALSYSVMLAFGINFLIELLLEEITNHKSSIPIKSGSIINIIRYSLFILPSSLIILMAAPAFAGNLFYNKETVKLPAEYLATFDYFNHQDATSRIADLPQPSFWGWTFYRWGSGGSGFIWYGLRQPVLDRAFDVWSDTSENYYYELSTALYSKNPTAVTNVLNKYQARFILLDENVIYPSSPKSLFYPETETLLSQMPNVKLDKQFGKIKIYKVALRDKPKSFVFTAESNLPKVQIPSWKSTDAAYSNIGNYISIQNTEFKTPNTIYPFTLFSERTADKKDFTLEDTSGQIVITKKITIPKNSSLVIPNILTEKNVTAIIFASSDQKGVTTFIAQINPPQIEIDGKIIQGASKILPLFILPASASYPMNINVNGVSNFNLAAPVLYNQKIGTTLLSTIQDNAIVIANPQGSRTQTITKSAMYDLLSGIDSKMTIPSGVHNIRITSPKVDDPYYSFTPALQSLQIQGNCDTFRSGFSVKDISPHAATFDNLNSSTCASFSQGTLSHNISYAMFVNTTNLSGRTFHFWVLNEDNKRSQFDTYIAGRTESYVLPPMEDTGLAYSFHFDNISIGQDETKNSLSKFAVYPIPYKLITGISINSQNLTQKGLENTAKSVSHANTSLYRVNLSNSKPTTLILSQSYDAGWHAYAVKNSDSRIVNFASLAAPFVFGTEIKQHVEVNSWENGWTVDSAHAQSQTIIIVYLPQYLEYAGFAVLSILALIIFCLLANNRLSKRKKASHAESLV